MLNISLTRSLGRSNIMINESGALSKKKNAPRTGEIDWYFGNLARKL